MVFCNLMSIFCWLVYMYVKLIYLADVVIFVGIIETFKINKTLNGNQIILSLLQALIIE